VARRSHHKDGSYPATVSRYAAIEREGEVATLEIFAERLANIGLWCVVIALAVELAFAGNFMPSFEVVNNALVEQRALGIARVLGFRFCTRLHMQFQKTLPSFHTEKRHHYSRARQGAQ
jgi:hypothetical protein